ncbi:MULTISPECIES: hypothetical protein [Flavobacterium]|uniref:hypothetical protein n=1 Tax=Flavobacterium TaxID=237 RepID=UPI0011844F86|nr:MULTISPECIES: hypothetical protein [Flavobacterium]MCR4030072.1 hypothetical protein [Flavobacterium panacis]
MIKTKYTFIIFVVLLVLMFPYLILFVGSDFLSSLVPGWNTSFFGGAFINDLFIFIVLSISVYLYWKLSKNKTEISLKHFLIHFLLTIPAIIFSKSDSFELIEFDSLNPENFIWRIYFVIYFLTALFFIGQILFWRYYTKITR